METEEFIDRFEHNFGWRCPYQCGTSGAVSGFDLNAVRLALVEHVVFAHLMEVPSPCASS